MLIKFFIFTIDIIYQNNIISSHTFDPMSMINLYGIELGNILINHFKNKLNTCLYFIFIISSIYLFYFNIYLDIYILIFRPYCY